MRVRRDTTNRGLMPSRGTTTNIGFESFGSVGGDFTFQRITASWDGYRTLSEDLAERKTILELHVDAGYIIGDAPFFERFYGGGIGSIRGFSFRGVSPRSGPADDRVGGDFSLFGSAEVSFPLSGDNLRGVVFLDAGTVEEDFEIGTIRTSIGAGIRLVLPFLGQTPIAGCGKVWRQRAMSVNVLVGRKSRSTPASARHPRSMPWAALETMAVFWTNTPAAGGAEPKTRTAASLMSPGPPSGAG